MKRTRHISHTTDPTHRGTAVRSTAARNALWVLGPLAIAIAVSLVLGLAGAAADWMGAVWLAAVFWAIAASFVQALRQGLRHGDWSAFSDCEPPPDDEDFDFFTRTGRYSYLRHQADDEALMRDGTGFSKITIKIIPSCSEPRARLGSDRRITPT